MVVGLVVGSARLGNSQISDCLSDRRFSPAINNHNSHKIGVRNGPAVLEVHRGRKSSPGKSKPAKPAKPTPPPRWWPGCHTFLARGLLTPPHLEITSNSHFQQYGASHQLPPQPQRCLTTPSPSPLRRPHLRRKFRRNPQEPSLTPQSPLGVVAGTRKVRIIVVVDGNNIAFLSTFPHCQIVVSP